MILHQQLLEIQTDPQSYKHYQWDGMHLRRHGRLVVGNHNNLETEVITLMHDTPQACHSGHVPRNATILSPTIVVDPAKPTKRFRPNCRKLVICFCISMRSLPIVPSSPLAEATYQRLRQVFSWKIMKKGVAAYVRACVICQHSAMPWTSTATTNT